MAEQEPTKLGAVAVVGADGPMVAVCVGELVLCLSMADAEMWGRALLREAGRAEGLTVMAAGMEVCGLSPKTRDKALAFATRHTVGAKRGEGR